MISNFAKKKMIEKKINCPSLEIFSYCRHNESYPTIPFLNTFYVHEENGV